MFCGVCWKSDELYMFGYVLLKNDELCMFGGFRWKNHELCMFGEFSENNDGKRATKITKKFTSNLVIIFPPKNFRGAVLANSMTI